MYEPPWYGTVCPVVWEDGGGNPASYPIAFFSVLAWQASHYRGTAQISKNIQNSIANHYHYDNIDLAFRHTVMKTSPHLVFHFTASLYNGSTVEGVCWFASCNQI